MVLGGKPKSKLARPTVLVLEGIGNWIYCAPADAPQTSGNIGAKSDCFMGHSRDIAREVVVYDLSRNESILISNTRGAWQNP